jgi:hypothetical protein
LEKSWCVTAYKTQVAKNERSEKTRDVLNSGELSEDQHFLALGFESEGYVPAEA